jgi:HEAT repeat protein
MTDTTMIDLVWMTTFVTALFIMAILGLIFTLQLWRRYRVCRQDSFRAQWRPVLSRSMIEEVDPLPPLAGRDHYLYLELWMVFQESITGEARERLNRLALRLGMEQAAIRLSQAVRLRPRLIAITALGHIQPPQAWGLLCGLLGHHNPAVSLAAARALVRIDTSRALPLVVPLIKTRHDWSLVKVVQVLGGAEAEHAAFQLAQVALTARSDEAAKLIRVIESIRGQTALPLIRSLVDARPDDTAIVPAALRLFGQCKNPQDLPRLRHYVRHAHWCIRLHAATALGKMGTMEDESRLIAMLGDEHWWVRYRAAEGLSRLSLMTKDRLVAIRARFADTPTASILDSFISQLSTPIDRGKALA